MVHRKIQAGGTLNSAVTGIYRSHLNGIRARSESVFSIVVNSIIQAGGTLNSAVTGFCQVFGYLLKILHMMLVSTAHTCGYKTGA